MASALSECFSILTARVLISRSVSQQSNALGIAPSAFWEMLSFSCRSSRFITRCAPWRSVVAHDPREDAKDPAIAVVRHDDVVSFLQEREGRRDGAHATREREGVLRAFQTGEAVLQRVPRRVRAARVRVLVLSLPGVCRGQ